MKKIIPIIIVILIIAGVAYLMTDRVSWGTVRSQTLHLSFDYPIHSSYGTDPLKGTVQALIPYDHTPTSLTDWSLSSGVKNAIMVSMDCGPLKATGAYLPLDRDMPMQCGVVKSPSGLVSVYAVGVGRPNGGTSYPESMVLTFTDGKAAMLTKVVPFVQTQKEANADVTKFTQLHPNAVIWPPDANAKQLYTDVDNVVIKAISTPYEEVTTGIQTLQKIASSEKAL